MRAVWVGLVAVAMGCAGAAPSAPDTSAHTEARLSQPDPLAYELERAAHVFAPGTSPLSDVHMATLAPGQHLHVPTIVPAGMCVRVIGVTERGSVLDLRALDRDEQVLAQSAGDGPVAVVGTGREYLCARGGRPQTLQLEIAMRAGPGGRIAVRNFGRAMPAGSDGAAAVLGLLVLLAL